MGECCSAYLILSHDDWYQFHVIVPGLGNYFLLRGPGPKVDPVVTSLLGMYLLHGYIAFFLLWS